MPLITELVSDDRARTQTGCRFKYLKSWLHGAPGEINIRKLRKQSVGFAGFAASTSLKSGASGEVELVPRIIAHLGAEVG